MRQISILELKEKMAENPNLHLLDCREPFEYEQGNIGGKLVPLGKIQTHDVGELEPLKDQEIIIYCRSGKRSMMACLTLESLGFINTVNVEGGLLAWQEKFGDLGVR